MANFFHSDIKIKNNQNGLGKDATVHLLSLNHIFF